MGDSSAASKTTFRISEKPRREPESPAARSCSFSSFPVPPWSGDRFGLGGISHPWKVSLPLSEPLWDGLGAAPIRLPEGWALPSQGWGAGAGLRGPSLSPAPALRAEDTGRGGVAGAGSSPGAGGSELSQVLHRRLPRARPDAAPEGRRDAEQQPVPRAGGPGALQLRRAGPGGAAGRWHPELPCGLSRGDASPPPRAWGRVAHRWGVWQASA